MNDIIFLMFYLNMAIYLYCIIYIKIMFGFPAFGRRMMQVAAKSYSIGNKYSFSQSLTWSNMYCSFNFPGNQVHCWQEQLLYLV